MQYLLMINQNEPDTPGPSELAEITAKSVRVGKAGRTVHDGPFSEIREQLGGYYLIEAADQGAAIEWAKKIPGWEGCGVEVRPVFQMRR